MDENRRSFLKKAGCTALGLGCGLPLLSTGCSALKEDPDDEGSSQSQLAMVIDVRKCLKKEVRDACIRACKEAHNLPTVSDPESEVEWIWSQKYEIGPEREVKWIWEEEYETAFPDQAHDRIADELEGLPVLVLCNHCTDPACVKVCPTAATWKRKQDGVVMMDMHRCIGCRYCVVACPYGARSFNWRDGRPNVEAETHSEYPERSRGVVEKCNFCAERIRENLDPHCVEAARNVPGGEGALTFGDLSDPESDVSRLLRTKHTICRKLALGTGPNVYYILDPARIPETDDAGKEL